MRLEGDLSGWEVWVETEDGARLNEHEPEIAVGDQNVSSCYLETPKDNDLTSLLELTLRQSYLVLKLQRHVSYPHHFSIKVSKPETEKPQDYAVKVKIDSRDLGSHSYKNIWGGIKTWDAMYTEEDGVLYSSKIKFARTITTDDIDLAVKDIPTLVSLGEIRVIIHSGRWVKQERSAASQRRSASAYSVKSSAGPVLETHKKARMEMSINAGDRSRIDAEELQNRIASTYTDVFLADDDEANHIIKFTYFSRAMLMAQNKIPTPPAPALQAPAAIKKRKARNPPREDTVQCDDEEEAAAAKAFLEERRAAKKAHRQETSSSRATTSTNNSDLDNLQRTLTQQGDKAGAKAVKSEMLENVAGRAITRVISDGRPGQTSTFIQSTKVYEVIELD